MSRSTPKRHCMVVHAHYPVGETRVERQAQALVNHGYQVDVLCLRNDSEPATESANGIAIYRLPVKRHKQRSAAVQLLEYLAFFVLVFFKLTTLQLRQRYGVVQVHNLPDFLVFAALIPKLMGTRLILDLHDLMPEFYASRFETDLTNSTVKLVAWQEKISCAFASHVITVTDLWRHSLIERGVPADKVSVVMNVPDETVFHQGYDITPADGLHLIYHGNLTERYGLDLAVQAVAQLQQRLPNLRLTIHGAGPFLETLQQMVKKLNLQQRVHFSTQGLPTADLPRLIKTAHAGIVPYRRDVFTDGILPTKLMEYVALGLPVIAARTPVITDYFDDEMAAYFEPDNVTDLTRAIQTMVDPANRQTIAAHADAFNQQYNWRDISDAYTALVHRLGGYAYPQQQVS